MARPSNFPNSRLAKLRQHLGLQQEHLALFLGISRSLLANIEANRRPMSRAVYERAAPLLALLPDAPAPELALPTLLLPAVPAPGPLAARRDFCVWRATNLRYELRALHSMPGPPLPAAGSRPCPRRFHARKRCACK